MNLQFSLLQEREEKKYKIMLVYCKFKYFHFQKRLANNPFAAYLLENKYFLQAHTPSARKLGPAKCPARNSHIWTYTERDPAVARAKRVAAAEKRYGVNLNHLPMLY